MKSFKKYIGGAAALCLLGSGLTRLNSEIQHRKERERSIEAIAGYAAEHPAPGSNVTVAGLMHQYAVREFDSGVSYSIHVTRDNKAQIKSLEVTTRGNDNHQWIHTEPGLFPTEFIRKSREYGPYIPREIPVNLALQIISGYLRT